MVTGAIDFAWPEPIGSLARVYGVLAGTSFGYSFFAPTVNPNILVRFEIKNADGTQSRDTLDSGANREAAIRISNIAEAFDGRDAELRKSLAASWAGTIFARHSRAQSVTVIVESCDVPPMSEYLKGEREHRLKMYDATFVWPAARENQSAGGGVKERAS